MRVERLRARRRYGVSGDVGCGDEYVAEACNLSRRPKTRFVMMFVGSNLGRCCCLHFRWMTRRASFLRKRHS